jgi:hypothetical protein
MWVCYVSVCVCVCTLIAHVEQGWLDSNVVHHVSCLALVPQSTFRTCIGTASSTQVLMYPAVDCIKVEEIAPNLGSMLQW